MSASRGEDIPASSDNVRSVGEVSAAPEGEGQQREERERREDEAAQSSKKGDEDDDDDENDEFWEGK